MSKPSRGSPWLGFSMHGGMHLLACSVHDRPAAIAAWVRTLFDYLPPVLLDHGIEPHIGVREADRTLYVGGKDTDYGDAEWLLTAMGFTGFRVVIPGSPLMACTIPLRLLPPPAPGSRWWKTCTKCGHRGPPEGFPVRGRQHSVCARCDERVREQRARRIHETRQPGVPWGMKRCGGPCGRVMPAEDFPWWNRKAGRRGSRCAECDAARQREAYHARKAKTGDVLG